MNVLRCHQHHTIKDSRRFPFQREGVVKHLHQLLSLIAFYAQPGSQDPQASQL